MYFLLGLSQDRLWEQIKDQLGPIYCVMMHTHIVTISIQSIEGAICKAPAKRSQHINTTYRNIVGRNLSRVPAKRSQHCWAQFVACVWPSLCDIIEVVPMPGCNIVARIARTWPNDHNIMQHPKLLHEKFDHFQALAKRSQHFNATYRSIVGATCCARLPPCCDVLRCVTICWVLLTQIWTGQIFHATFVDVAWCCGRLARFLQQCCAWACALVQFSTRNMPQHVATWWPNARNMLRPTMLRYVASKCCDRLAEVCK